MSIAMRAQAAKEKQLQEAEDRFRKAREKQAEQKKISIDAICGPDGALRE